MERLYDPTLKALVETAPADWLALLHLPSAPVTVIDADIAAVLSGAADKVLRVQTDPAYLLHLDFQDEATASAIQAIADVQHLEELLRRTVHAPSWGELLGQPRPRRRHGRRKTTP